MPHATNAPETVVTENNNRPIVKEVSVKLWINFFEHHNPPQNGFAIQVFSYPGKSSFFGFKTSLNSYHRN